MKRVSLEFSEFDLKYIYKVLKQDSLYSKTVLKNELYADEEEKVLLEFCSKHSKNLSDKVLEILEDIDNV